MDYLHELSRRESTYLYRSMLIRLFVISNTVVTGHLREKIAIYPQQLAQYVYVYIYCIHIREYESVCIQIYASEMMYFRKL